MSWIRSHIAFLFLLLIGVVLAFANYTPDTFLSGWDTLHPELDFPLAFQRMFFGVWRSNQGLGAVAIQSHMADLPRVFFLWLESLIVPLSLLRYSYFFLMLIAGILGMFFLTKKIINRKNGSSIAFLSGLTYLTNLGTVQHFIVPLEMFATQYGLLPWILLTTWQALEEGSKKSFLLFALIILFATPQAHTATLFFSFLLVWCATLVTYVVLSKNLHILKRSILLVSITFCINAFWLLPNLYTITTHGRQVRESKINRLFSPEAFTKNQEFGNARDVPLLKNFLFDWKLFNTKTNQFEEVMARWESHLSHPAIHAFGYLVFVLALFGITQSFRRRNRIGITMLPLFIIPFFFLLNGTFPVNRLFDIIGTISPILKEALRFPFTKFSILLMVAMSFYVGQGLASIFNRFKSLSKGIAISYTMASLVYFSPAFQGYLIHPAMRVSFPNEYFVMFDWFKKQDPNGRVALLPIHTFWGWTYYSWGYQGAGFLQFGIPQPLMDRDYNRWSSFNERYQQEMSYAIYSQNPAIIVDVLNKYHVQWIVLDRSVISPSNKLNSILSWRIPGLLEQTGEAILVKTFGNNLSVYQITPNKSQVGTVLPDVTLNDRFTGQQGRLITEYSGGTYTSTNNPTLNHISLPDLAHEKAYVVTIQSRNIQGFPIQVCISNNLTSHCDLFTHLEKNSTMHTEKFFLPPLADYGTGYTINVNNFAIRGMTSINEIGSTTIYEAHVSDLTLTRQDPKITTMFQSFDPGWIAWDGKQLLPHVLVNNWANGWILSNKLTNQPVNQLTIFFLPQLLEWIGFILLPLPFLAIILYDRNVWQRHPRQQKYHKLLKSLLNKLPKALG